MKISIHILTSSFLISKVTSFIEFLISHPFSLHNFYLHRLGNRFFGVVLFEIIFIYFITRKQYSLKILDILSQSTAMGLVIGKLGCYLSGHGCFGIQGFGFLFQKVAYGSFSTSTKVFQYTIVEILTYLVLSIYLFAYTKNKNGYKFISFIIIFVILHFGLNPFKTHHYNLFLFPYDFYIILTILIFGIFVFYKENLFHLINSNKY